MASLLDRSSERKDRPIPPADVHDAICYGVVVLGTQTKDWQGKEKKDPVVRILWELPKQRAAFEEGKPEQPLQVFCDYNIYTDDKANLMKMLRSWFPVLQGKPIELAKALKGIVGKSCRLMIEHRKSKDGQKTFANIMAGGTGVLAAKEALGKPENKTLFFPFDPEAFNWSDYNELPKWLQKNIEKSDEWAGILSKYGQNPTGTEQPKQEAKQEIADDDLPF